MSKPTTQHPRNEGNRVESLAREIYARLVVQAQPGYGPETFARRAIEAAEAFQIIWEEKGK